MAPHPPPGNDRLRLGLGVYLAGRRDRERGGGVADETLLALQGGI